MVRYGAKSLPYGGWWCIPPLAGDGWMILATRRASQFAAAEGNSPGDQERNAGGRDRLRRHGETGFFAAVFGNVSGPGGEELDQDGALAGAQFPSGIRERISVGMFHAGIQQFTGGRGLQAHYTNEAGHRRMKHLAHFRRMAARKRTLSVPPRATASSPSTSSPIFITRAPSTKKISRRIWSFMTPTSATNAA